MIHLATIKICLALQSFDQNQPLSSRIVGGGSGGGGCSDGGGLNHPVHARRPRGRSDLGWPTSKPVAAIIDHRSWLALDTIPFCVFLAEPSTPAEIRTCFFSRRPVSPFCRRVINNMAEWFIVRVRRKWVKAFARISHRTDPICVNCNLEKMKKMNIKWI